MPQTWDVTLLSTLAAGYGNTVSAGYDDGNVSGGQAWPVTLLDGSVTGYGNTVSGHFDTGVSAAGEVAWYTIDVTVLQEGATRPFHAPLDTAYVLAPLDVANVLAPLDVAAVYAPLDVTHVLAPLDMETETA